VRELAARARGASPRRCAGDRRRHPSRPGDPAGALRALRLADDPQVFVRGELVGGADIVEELEDSGELEQTLAEKLGPDYRDSRDEKTVAVL
jgi:hypothetical protein